MVYLLQIIQFVLAMAIAGVTPANAAVGYSETAGIVRQYQGVSYMSGGITKDEREEMARQEKNFNLKLVLAQDNGDYLSDVNVTITAKDGKKVLEAVTDGPVFYTQLTPGQYNVRMDNAGSVLAKDITLLGTDKLGIFHFYWKR